MGDFVQTQLWPSTSMNSCLGDVRKTWSKRVERKCWTKVLNYVIKLKKHDLSSCFKGDQSKALLSQRNEHCLIMFGSSCIFTSSSCSWSFKPFTGPHIFHPLSRFCHSEGSPSSCDDWEGPESPSVCVQIPWNYCIWNYDYDINHETSWLMITILILLNPFTYASWTTHCVSTGIAEALGVGVQCVGPTSGGGRGNLSPINSPTNREAPHPALAQSKNNSKILQNGWWMESPISRFPRT